MISNPDFDSTHDTATQAFEMPRRSFLSGLGLLTFTAFAGGDTAVAQTRQGQLRRLETAYDTPYIQELPEETYYAPLQLSAVETNPRLSGHIPNNGIAYAVTHAGFMDKDSGDVAEHLRAGRLNSDATEEFLRAREGIYGDYDSYRHQIELLFDKLRETEAPVICFSEAADIANPHFPRPELRPPADAFLVQTHAGAGTLKATVEIATDTAPYHQTEIQRPNRLFAALQRSGVREVRVAGEYGFSLYQPRSLACLGATSYRLEDAGFIVRGIEGAVFPSDDTNTWLNNPYGNYPMRNALYGDGRVSFDSVH